jgi:hypothetical protein
MEADRTGSECLVPESKVLWQTSPLPIHIRHSRDVAAEKKARLSRAGHGERNHLGFVLYLFFLAAFFFAGINSVTSSPRIQR